MILEQCKGVLCVDLEESFQTHIFLQNFVSIQPRASPRKFAASRGAAGFRARAAFPAARTEVRGALWTRHGWRHRAEILRFSFLLQLCQATFLGYC